MVDKTARLTITEADFSDSGTYNVSVGRSSKKSVVEVQSKIAHDISEEIEEDASKLKSKSETVNTKIETDANNLFEMDIQKASIGDDRAQKIKQVEGAVAVEKSFDRNDETAQESDYELEADASVDMVLLKNLMSGNKISKGCKIPQNDLPIAQPYGELAAQVNVTNIYPEKEDQFVKLCAN